MLSALSGRISGLKPNVPFHSENVAADLRKRSKRRLGEELSEVSGCYSHVQVSR
jgi:hypothetical protein